MPNTGSCAGFIAPTRQAAMRASPHRRDLKTSVGITHGQGPNG
ncbi:hypothetical protein HMPREF9621_00148 [Cutibacterium modestum HL037PA2]|uniref:Uncharacterized protein n=1 Tax=Cutibacterium modestum HL044PA1 TaxID=765109 RepID=A0ABP2K3Q5_9ACTN|nr:hypothetical protein HMPREF9621_00148 [Cutibacterium modestum HL037PA2]EFS91358.1 hypothetical protein HMPREF9607_02651 [Cutibacterium modestum HL044PA1]